MVEQPHGKHRIRTAKLVNTCDDGGVIIGRADEVDVIITLAGESVPGSFELLLRTVDGDHTIE